MENTNLTNFKNYNSRKIDDICDITKPWLTNNEVYERRRKIYRIIFQ